MKPDQHKAEGIPLPPDAHAPALFDNSQRAAIQALARGEADEGQQRLALNWIIESACRTYDQPYRPDVLGGARATDFACGRMFVGQQIVHVLKSPVLKEPNREGGKI